jgi:LysM repeat protein
MLRETRPDDALAAFLQVIKNRPDDAPESHLEAGRILLNYKNDPVEAIHHFRAYLAVMPNSDEAPMVKQMIDTAMKQFARSLPGNKDAYDEMDLIDQIAALKSENEKLRAQLSGAPLGSGAMTFQKSTPPPATDNRSLSRPGNPLTPAAHSTVAPPATTPVTAAPPARTYVVQSGDTLSAISMKIYGVRSRYLEIYNANTDQLASPNAVLHVGMVLKLPQ